MFPIYEALTFENIILEGGSTRPLIFLVDTKTTYKQFVVKVFSQKDREQYNPTAKECYAYILAEEFSLQQPEAAIIKFGEDFLANIPEETAKRIRDSGSLFHYGTELLNGYSLFYQDLANADLVEYEIESVFAFDIFIHNVDRRNLKPNFLIKEEEYCLIDHELSLNVNETLIELTKQCDFSYLYNNPIFKEHIFLAPLKKLNKKFNIRFQNFDYHLNALNLKKLDAVKIQLDEIGIDTSDYYLIKSYIAEIKLRSGAFVKMLNNFF